MRTIQFFFQCMKAYQKCKFDLLCQYESHKADLSIWVAQTKNRMELR